MRGSERVGDALRAWLRAGLRGAAAVERREINGLPGILVFDAEGGLVGVLSVEVSGGEIVGINSVVNPDKLRHLGRVGDLRAMLRRD